MTSLDTVSLVAGGSDVMNDTKRADCEALPYIVYSPQMIVPMLKMVVIAWLCDVFYLIAKLSMTSGDGYVIALTKPYGV